MWPPGPRALLTAVGLAFLAYGAVLAWDAHSTAVVLAIGSIFLFFALVLPIDWERLNLKLWGASLEVERAKVAQETLASLPREVQRELVQQEQLEPAEVVPEVESAPPEEVPAPAAGGGAAGAHGGGSAAARSRLIEDLRTRPAFASHEVFDGWIRLRLKRLAPPSDAELAVTCIVRRPGGEFLVGVPRLVGSAEPPMILGAFPRGGAWLNYEATFPDFFATEDEELPPGTYTVIWGTLLREGGHANVLAMDSFEWPPASEQ